MMTYVDGCTPRWERSFMNIIRALLLSALSEACINDCTKEEMVQKKDNYNEVVGIFWPTLATWDAIHVHFSSKHAKKSNVILQRLF